MKQLLAVWAGLVVLTTQPVFAAEASSVWSNDSAKSCVTRSLQRIQSEPSTVGQLIDRQHVQAQIKDAFGVNGLFLLLHTRHIREAARELARSLPQAAAGEAIIDRIGTAQSAAAGNTLFGAYGKTPIEVDARFLTDGTCPIVDVRFAGFGVLSLLIGQLGSTTVFAERLESVDFDGSGF